MLRGRSDQRVVAGFALLVVLIGTNLVAIRYSNRELPPFWNAGFRFVLASLIFGVILITGRRRLPSGFELAGAVAYGLLGFAGFFGFLYAGLVRAPAALGQTMLALGPLITMFLAAAIGTERLRTRAVAGSFLSLAGVAVSFGAASALDVPAISLLALIAAATSFSAGGIVSRRLREADPVGQNLVATAVGGIVLLAISAAVGERWALPVTPGTWLAFVYLVGPGTVLIFLLFLALLRRWTATAVSYQFVLAPLVAVALSALLLHESIGPVVIVGAVFVLAGVYLGALAPTR